jgi:hypothetical protein
MIKSFIQLGIISILIVLVFANCKKMKPSKAASTEETEVDKPIVIVPPKKMNMLPIKLKTSDLTVDIVYSDKTALMTDIKFSNGIRYVITYADKILKKLQKYKDDVQIQTADYLITDSKVSRVARFNVSGSRSTPTEKYYLEYNTSLQINNIKTYAVSNALFSEQSFGYNKDGNLLSSVMTIGSSINTYAYKYDDKNAAFKSVLFSQLLRIEINEDFLNSGINNLVKVSNPKQAKDDIDFEYVYGADEYPNQLKIKKQGVTQVYNITYVELK